MWCTCARSSSRRPPAPCGCEQARRAVEGIADQPRPLLRRSPQLACPSPLGRPPPSRPAADLDERHAEDGFPARTVRVPAVTWSGLPIERFDPAADVVEDAKGIVEAAGMDLGGVEYHESARDGQPHFYDVNALWNFVASAAAVVGFGSLRRSRILVLERVGARPGSARDGGVGGALAAWLRSERSFGRKNLSLGLTRSRDSL